MAKAERPAVSMREVAEHAGVSTMTVSRMLNGSAHVRAATRRRVEAAIAELNYRPNAIARALARGRTRQIGLLIHSYSQFGPMRVLESMCSAARAAGYAALISTVGSGQPEEFSEALESITDACVDGVAIIAPVASAHEALGALALPSATVVLGGPSTMSRGGTAATPHAQVSIDQRLGATLAVRHLVDRGHRVIAHVAGPDNWFDAVHRREAWEQELQRTGLPCSPSVQGDWSAQSGFDAARQLVEIPGLTAVFTANDQMALGVIGGLAALGYRVPEDVSVIGFDDQPEAAHFLPPLTTVRQDFEALGRLGMNKILAALGERDPVDEERVIPKLVQRGSVRSI